MPLPTYDPASALWPRGQREFVLDPIILAAPKRVHGGEIMIVTVSLTNVNALVDALHGQYARRGLSGALPITVRLFCDGIQFDEQEVTILIRNSGETTPCQFFGRAERELPPAVSLRELFYHEDRYAGGARLQVPAAESVGASTIALDPPAAFELPMPVMGTVHIDLAAENPDFQLEILFRGDGSADWIMRGRILRGKRFRSREVIHFADFQEWYADHFRKISQAFPDQAIRLLEAMGNELYINHAANCFREIYPLLHREHGAFSILTHHERAIPWELMLSPASDLAFLCIDHPVARVIADYESMRSRLSAVGSWQW